MSGIEPVYWSRGQKVKWGIVTLIVGLLAWQASRLLGRLLVAGALSMFASAVIRGEERIA